MRPTPLASFLLACVVTPAVAGTFQDIGVAGGQLTGLSHNGRIASGTGGDGAWRWNKDRGATTLTGFVASNGMNDWGQPVAGAWTDADGHTVAALAYSNSDLVGEPVVIGAFPGGVGFDNALSEAYDASDTGVAVGLAYDASSIAFAFRWTAPEGMTRLTVNRPTTTSRANAISSDGSTIVGFNDQDDGSRTGVIWQGGAPLDLVGALGAGVGPATAVNADGSVVVGEGYTNPDTGDSEAWRWTAATGVQPIGCIQTATCGPAFAFAVSDDGNTIVGAEWLRRRTPGDGVDAGDRNEIALRLRGSARRDDPRWLDTVECRRRFRGRPDDWRLGPRPIEPRLVRDRHAQERTTRSDPRSARRRVVQ